MEFYTYQYFVNQSGQSHLMKYIIFVSLLALLLLVVLKKFRSRDKMKYRDLIILVSLAIVFMAGMQVNEYEVGKNDRNNSFQMVNFLDNISENQKKEPKELAVNSKYVKDEMLIKIDNTYYQINMNADLSSFKLEETYLLNVDQVKMVEE
ncbi:DUF3290 domain-containing protein [Vagococcus carniphilus]|uniref:DUF3290 domain-containing protein n=1 Tax=Vagococcus carniphilus TaxID=218144 RepID=A0AAW8U5U5_9ENTE|nr:DUF3290 domain-containing protein [Vagococcus carniphilus]MDT2813539.1 DUF3290 domain-containing protein [Vagococcus carniphilus]MDT2829958.1 DUF3290 domain-containing protein [Vagococcus carniphilus]MDT2834918.1 DUF3290 domain-containing protein [Vagococcus carniphilus]MDT2838393.1 DUF3290 domain-containing protein [Vagococcus carniphilus]MDT2850142.1 DUF3290 domain-containing protein [Vagococcus carniphilus]